MFEIFMMIVVFGIFAAIGLFLIQMAFGFIVLVLSVIVHGIIWVVNKVKGE